ncbi:4-carboxymuconolactone decarboxylase OS=Tsukamurella paurometabola (strain ATCC 8368 / DSM /CCUG 35730 / CIP 100753 / JCM 10117 / KCTC 9821 / NBRC 16120/ NCIMB 702349 / NCTC 13040) OX=521096 GN=Tpau_0618 PE=4 SV=1 [Tsukamurella paurometabola]|uniref:4-carboxymuconolactone decarboxylase n=1 Tax=Tsukamurella paurometabola (strain ATCC 8368 / DSM 20162 / CCUG 35730 / CIP 100753 / JCM 10117 / KCTC 9821 / NBRC 16120 / NCIMB 702349 / NCTC 13040) TaxID=521096 RepID=D5USW9_TSUPD|nr:alpha/beta fold hydrolase [Tsukamurella paurometabola]ADG77256.1 4-carboxymuconolactone decarboxylase [Tsukamurella paurometabola DSM 20162]SUP43300.1 3-oxoadipate enol-lactonase 2 [Tsukamurella paurometabola]
MIPRLVATAPTCRPPGHRELLVLGPSLGTSAAIWQTVAELLGDRYDMLAWDLPGHGGSPSPDGAFDLGELADAVLALVDSHDPGVAFHYAGDSVGGAVGAELALRAPDRVRSLAMVCSAARFGDPGVWRDRAATVRAQGTTAMIPGAKQRWLSNHFLVRSPAVAEDLFAGLASVSDAGYAAVCEALAGYDVRDRLPSLQIPFLAVGGELDVVCPPREVRALADAVPQGRHEVLAGVAHLAPVEAPHLVAAALADHCAAATARAVRSATVTARQRYDAGMAVRRQVLGDAHVDRATVRGFGSDFQEFITRTAWGDVWTGTELTRRERSIAVLTALLALGHWNEFAMHVRAALRNGLGRDEIEAVLMQSAIYCGVPAANAAFGIARRVFAEIDAEEGKNADA